jgi:hypothetical protein
MVGAKQEVGVRAVLEQITPRQRRKHKNTTKDRWLLLRFNRKIAQKLTFVCKKNPHMINYKRLCEEYMYKFLKVRTFKAILSFSWSKFESHICTVRLLTFD